MKFAKGIDWLLAPNRAGTRVDPSSECRQEEASFNIAAQPLNIDQIVSRFDARTIIHLRRPCYQQGYLSLEPHQPGLRIMPGAR